MVIFAPELARLGGYRATTENIRQHRQRAPPHRSCEASNIFVDVVVHRLIAPNCCLLSNSVLKISDEIVLQKHPSPTNLRPRQFAHTSKIQCRGAIDLQKVGGFVNVVGSHGAADVVAHLNGVGESDRIATTARADRTRRRCRHR
jgi:hypothetical protein